VFWLVGLLFARRAIDLNCVIDLLIGASVCRRMHLVVGDSTQPVYAAGAAYAAPEPIGATGAVLTARLTHAMRRKGLKRGVVTLCIGGGQGIALALEALN
jgi:acetyl-CoA acetyltransferase